MNKTTKYIIWVIIIVGIALAIYALSSKQGSGPATGEPIKIGFIGPLTGDGSNIGQNAKAATEISVDEINKAGGINGRPIEMIYEDGKCNGKEAVSAVNKLINIDKVSVIFGGACSAETMAITSITEQAKMPTLSYCSSNPAITNAGDYIFRNIPSDTFQGTFAADYVFNALAKKNVAVLFGKTDWATGIKEVFVKEFEKLGGKIVANEGYEQTATDLRSQLTKIKASKPDLLYFVGYSDASIPGLKQAAELKLSVPMFGADAWDDRKIYEGAGKAAEGIMYSVPASLMSDDFKAKMSVKTGTNEVTECSPQAYDGVKILAQVLTKAGVDPEAIKNELYKVDYKGGVSSNEIKFDSNGDLIGASYIVKVVKNGVSEKVK